MTLPPDRLDALVARIEAGETITRDELLRLSALQAADVARFGRQFVADSISRDEALTEVLSDGGT